MNNLEQVVAAARKSIEESQGAVPDFFWMLPEDFRGLALEAGWTEQEIALYIAEHTTERAK